LTFSGGVTVNVKGGNDPNLSCGIYTNGPLTISGGAKFGTVAGGTAPRSVAFATDTKSIPTPGFKVPVQVIPAGIYTLTTTDAYNARVTYQTGSDGHAEIWLRAGTQTITAASGTYTGSASYTVIAGAEGTAGTNSQLNITAAFIATDAKRICVTEIGAGSKDGSS